MSDAPKGSPQSPFLTVVISGSKRKQLEVSSATGLEQLVTESTSKKARRETNQSPVTCSSSSSKFSDDEKEPEPIVAKPQHENAEAELKRLQKDWTAPIYAFFKPTPTIECVGGRRVHVFECIAETCKARGKKARQVNRYLDKADARSTSNLRKHAKVCWGAEIVEAGDRTKNIEAARAVVAGIMARKSALASNPEGTGKGKLSYILATPTE